MYCDGVLGGLKYTEAYRRAFPEDIARAEIVGPLFARRAHIAKILAEGRAKKQQSIEGEVSLKDLATNKLQDLLVRPDVSDNVKAKAIEIVGRIQREEDYHTAVDVWKEVLIASGADVVYPGRDKEIRIPFREVVRVK